MTDCRYRVVPYDDITGDILATFVSANALWHLYKDDMVQPNSYEYTGLWFGKQKLEGLGKRGSWHWGWSQRQWGIRHGKTEPIECVQCRVFLRGLETADMMCPYKILRSYDMCKTALNFRDLGGSYVLFEIVSTAVTTLALPGVTSVWCVLCV